MLASKSKKQAAILFGILLAILMMQISCGTLARTNFERNRKLWRDSGTVNYRIKIYINKTGHATPNGKFTITVRGGKAESIKREDNSPVDMNTARFWDYDTLDDIFDFIERGTKDAPYKFEVEYDKQLGYPKKLDLDPKQRTLDDELFFQVLEFEVIE